MSEAILLLDPSVVEGCSCEVLQMLRDHKAAAVMHAGNATIA